MNLAAKIATLLLWATAAQAESVDVKIPRRRRLEAVCLHRYAAEQFHPARLLRQRAELHADQPARHLLPLLRAAARHLRRVCDGAIDGPVLQSEDQGLGLRWAVRLPDASGAELLNRNPMPDEHIGVNPGP
jgi:hypothetical protein